MDRVEIESLWFGCPDFADVFVGGEALEGPEPLGKVVGYYEVAEMTPKLVMGLVVEALNRGFLDGPVHPFDLAIGPRVSRFGQAMIDVILGAGKFKGMSPEGFAAFHRPLYVGRCRALIARCREVCAVVGENGTHLVRNRLEKCSQKIGGNARRGFLMQFSKGELRVGSIATNR